MVFQGVDSSIANSLCYGTIEEMWNILLPISVPKTYLKAQTSGFISHIDAQKVGEVCVSLGEYQNSDTQKWSIWWFEKHYIFQVQAEAELTLP